MDLVLFFCQSLIQNASNRQLQFLERFQVQHDRDELRDSQQRLLHDSVDSPY